MTNAVTLLTLTPDFDHEIQIDAVLQCLDRSPDGYSTSDPTPFGAECIEHRPCGSFSELLDCLNFSNSAGSQLVLVSVASLGNDFKQGIEDISSCFEERYVPIILLGTEDQSRLLIAAMQNGANDFIMLPASADLIAVKIQAQLRVSSMHAIMSEQHQAISQNHRHILREQEMAKEVFDKVAHDAAELPNINHWLSPIAVFNGDVLLSTPTPSGGLLILMGDFTGHGLGAAIGAIPLASTFYGMASKGFALYDIVNELNSKLNAVLPTGIFCCACVLQINFSTGIAEIWNAGLPDCYILRTDSTLEPLTSNALALGILGPEAFAMESARYSLTEGDKIYLLSDGLLETENTIGEQYGEQRLQRVLVEASCSNRQACLDIVKQNVLEFIGDQTRVDDISLVEINVVSADEFAGMYARDSQRTAQPPVSWSMRYQARAESLRHQDPVPLVLHMLLEEPNLRQCSGQLFSIVSELYNNALDHGLLKLSSDIKKQQHGFAKYYDLRLQRLEQLTQGSITFQMDYQADSEGGKLIVEVVDTGDGFDYRALTDASDQQSVELHGRGLALLHSICDNVEYRGCGNHVCVEYSW